MVKVGKYTKHGSYGYGYETTPNCKLAQPPCAHQQPAEQGTMDASECPAASFSFRDPERNFKEHSDTTPVEQCSILAKLRSLAKNQTF